MGRRSIVESGARNGFTLIELLVVVAILAAVMAILIGRGPMRSQGLQLRAAAAAMVESFRTARAAAIATNQNVIIAIDPGRRVFAVGNQAPVQLAANLILEAPKEALAGPGTVRLIRFSPDGSASGGEVTLGSGGKRIVIAVQWLTGQVTAAEAH